MGRIQFYPNNQLNELLNTTAKERNISTSSLVVEILLQYYNIKVEPDMDLAEAKNLVLSEIEEYIKTIPVGTTFDLLSASFTFKNIEMTIKGKPATNRATIGKIFVSKLGTKPFENVKIAYKDDGVTIKRSENNATMYEKISE